MVRELNDFNAGIKDKRSFVSKYIKTSLWNLL